VLIDVGTLEPKLKTPPSKRLRVQRDKFRKVLLGGLEEEIMWGKTLVDVRESSDGITAMFEDGSSYEGLILVGVDGSRSMVRQLVAPDPHLNHLPVRILGVLHQMTEDEAQPLLAIDPLMFVGSLPSVRHFAISFLYTANVFNPLDEDAHVRRPLRRFSFPFRIWILRLTILSHRYR